MGRRWVAYGELDGEWLAPAFRVGWYVLHGGAGSLWMCGLATRAAKVVASAGTCGFSCKLVLLPAVCCANCLCMCRDARVREDGEHEHHRACARPKNMKTRSKAEEGDMKTPLRTKVSQQDTAAGAP